MEQKVCNKMYAEIESLVVLGDILCDKGDFKNALDKYWEAFGLIPEPKTESEAATWILTAVGDTNFHKKNYVEAIETLKNAMNCPGAQENPYIHLRLGQCQFEIGNLDKAVEELNRAYDAKGEFIFVEEDPKYLEFLKSEMLKVS